MDFCRAAWSAGCPLVDFVDMVVFFIVFLLLSLIAGRFGYILGSWS